MIDGLFDNDTVGTGCFSYLPAEFVWAVTKRCNLRCLHCSIEASSEGELTLDEGKLLIEDAAALGDVKFSFTGGEPLMREDIYELISYAAGFDMQIVMATNATLITDKVAGKLLDAGLERFGVSIDGIGGAHDKIRGVKGAYERTMRGLEAAKDHGLSFQFHSMVTAYNLDEIPKIIDLAEELGAYRIYFVYLIPMGKAREIPEACITLEDNERFFEYIYERQKSSSVWLKPICNPQYWLHLKAKEEGGFRMSGCTAGITRFHIFPNGDVAPCAYLPVKAGNLREMRFGEILETSEVFRNLRERKLNGNCGVCRHRMACGGCRSRAYGFSGDYLGEDPVCGWFEVG
jgi:radical SAM protein with 4Fe4S-binding SPASM domain